MSITPQIKSVASPSNSSPSARLVQLRAPSHPMTYLACTTSNSPGALAWLFLRRSSSSSSYTKLLLNSPSGTLLPLSCWAGVDSSSLSVLNLTVTGYAASSSTFSSSTSSASGNTPLSTSIPPPEYFLILSRKNRSIRPWCSTICWNRDSPTMVSGMRPERCSCPVAGSGFHMQISIMWLASFHTRSAKPRASRISRLRHWRPSAWPQTILVLRLSTMRAGTPRWAIQQAAMRLGVLEGDEG